MITIIPSAVAVRENRWRKPHRCSFNSECNGAQKFILACVGLLVVAAMANAMAPPHPRLVEESTKHRELHESLFPNTTYISLPSLPSGIWESASDYKKRRRLHEGHRALEEGENEDEVCRYLSKENCQEIEESFSLMAAKSRARIIKGQQKGGLRKFNAGSNGQPYILKTLVVLVAWEDQQDRIGWVSRDDVDRLWNGMGTDDIIPTGSVKTYTERQAYGAVNFEADVIDWLVTDNTEAYYADKRSGMPKNGDREPHLRTAFHHVLEQMDAQNFPWGDYDSDQDGIIDSVQFLHSGYGAEIGGTDCYTNAAMEDRIWAHALPEGQAKWTSPKTGIELGGYAVSSVFRERCNGNIARLGVTMHEFYHTLGLPDLYDRDLPYASVQGKGGLGGIGVYDMMACPFGVNNNQMYPGSLSPWSKLEMGFLKEPIEITKSGFYTAKPSNDYPDVYAIKKGYPDGEMLLMENRQNIGHDATLPTGGMLIYKIDGTAYSNGNRNHGYPGQVDSPEVGQSWPSNGLHFSIALLQADGDYDLEQGYNNGDAEDFYNNIDQILGPGNGESVATGKGTYPNTDSYVNGDIKVTGTTIDKFRETPEGSGIFTFRVTFEGDEPVEWQAPTNAPTNKPTLPPTKPPSKKPTVEPTLRPTKNPTKNPTKTPTKNPTKNPTKTPTVSPTTVPTKAPTPRESPTKSPIESSTESPSESPTLAPIDVSECGHILQVNITTDDKPQETTWEIVSVSTGEYLTGYRSSKDLRPERKLEAYTEYGWNICVTTGDETSFIFRIFDTGSDGLTPPGKYSVGLNGNLIGSGSPFVNASATAEFDTKEI